MTSCGENGRSYGGFHPVSSGFSLHFHPLLLLLLRSSSSSSPVPPPPPSPSRVPLALMSSPDLSMSSSLSSSSSSSSGSSWSSLESGVHPPRFSFLTAKYIFEESSAQSLPSKWRNATAFHETFFGLVGLFTFERLSMFFAQAS